jgi:hypothetical protein
VLRFVERPPAVLPVTVAPEPVSAAPSPSGSRLWPALVAAALLIGLAAGFFSGRQMQPAMRYQPNNLLTRAMDDGRYSLTIVPGDVGLRQLIFLPGAGGTEPRLSDYLRPPSDTAELPADDTAGRVARWLTASRLVSGPHTAVVGSLVGASGDLHSRIAVRHPRDVTVRSLQQNSHVFLASRLMNPIVDMFEPKLTLRCENDGPNLRISIADTAAKSGERTRYRVEEPRDKISYGRIALLPNLGSDGGRVLLLSGLGAVGTEAAALVASDDSWVRVISERLPAGQLFFEALIEAKSANGLPVDLNLLIVRPVRLETAKR